MFFPKTKCNKQFQHMNQDKDIINNIKARAAEKTE